MKKRIAAIALLIGYIALLIFLTVKGLPGREEYKEKYLLRKPKGKKVNIAQKQIKKALILIIPFAIIAVENKKEKGNKYGR